MEQLIKSLSLIIIIFYFHRMRKVGFQFQATNKKRIPKDRSKIETSQNQNGKNT